eukprot:jgi/Ulvmu1/12365/UM009_0011.1
MELALEACIWLYAGCATRGGGVTVAHDEAVLDRAMSPSLLDILVQHTTAAHILSQPPSCSHNVITQRDLVRRAARPEPASTLGEEEACDMPSRDALPLFTPLLDPVGVLWQMAGSAGGRDDQPHFFTGQSCAQICPTHGSILVLERTVHMPCVGAEC